MDMSPPELSSSSNQTQYLPLTYQELTPSLCQKAAKELNESEENISSGLAKLKELIAAEQLIFNSEDKFLMLFLRAKKYDVDKSFQQLKRYSFEVHRQRKIFFSKNFTRQVAEMDTSLCGILPKRDQEGRAILYFSSCKFSSKDVDHEIVLGVLQTLLQFALSFPASQVSGVCLIVDASFSSIESVKIMFKYCRTMIPNIHTFPVRFKRIDCVNTNVLFQYAHKLIRPLLPSKVLRRVTFHGDQKDALLKIYPPVILPEEFGGTLGPLSEMHLTWIDEFKKRLQHMLNYNNYSENWNDD